MLQSEEFTNQLCILFEGLPIERKNRDCVSKWLVTLLTNENSKASAEYPSITKKIRDEILGESETNYFRRSSFYMSIKVMLQHNLTLQLGPVNGKLLYKIVMLNFLINICAAYKDYSTFDIDLLSQMIAKMGRRIEKLLSMTADTTPKGIHKLSIDVVTEAKKTIEIIRQKIDEQITNFQLKIEKKAQLLPLTGINFVSDISYKFPKLSKYLTERMKNIQTSDNDTVYVPKTHKRYFIENFPSVDSINESKDDIGKRIFWTEFEKMVLYEMNMDDQRWSDSELRIWSFAYAQYGKVKFKGNPLFVSRMLLIRLKLIAILDQLAVKQHPLLLEHESGINPNIINSLLIPQYVDMCIAYELENYFRKRNTEANDPSLIGEERTSDKSFSVKYAETNSYMLRIHSQILAHDKKNEAEKKKEFDRGREKMERYKSEANRRKCEYVENLYGYDTHSSSCTKCYFNQLAQSVRIQQYERLLPTSETQQLAVVFELQIPSEIVHLRDVLNDFVEYCFKENEPASLKIRDDWINRTILSSYTNNSSQIVKLGSTTWENMTDLLVDCPFDRFIVENTYNCVFHANKKNISDSFAEDAIKQLLTFKTRNEYAGLQWTLKSTNHSQNQVLSKQSQCCQELTLPEYINFGSLRADGHRLQLRKLYAMIETESLSFEKESVLALIMQTLWECGKSGDGNSIRESHIDFADAKFCSAMIELLEKFVSQQRNNWMHPFKLLIVTLIAVRAYEINSNEAIAIEIVQLLRKIRIIALDWMSKIEHAIRGMANPTEKIEQELRMKLIYVAIVGGATFFINPNHKNYEKIFEIDTETGLTAIRAWLQFIVCLKNSIRMYTNDESKLPQNVCMFLRLMECIGVSLEPKMNMMIKQTPNNVYKLIKMLWSRAERASFQPIQFRMDFPHLLVVEVIIESKKQIVTIDIITGSFLVDGFPLSRLPNNILGSKIYSWFFKNVVFEVQPDGDSYSTVHKFNDCNYEFKLINGDQIIITERKVNHFEKELIDHRILDGDFPHHLVQNYSHWWNKQEECIEFRCRAQDKVHFSKATNIEYRFNLKNLYLRREQTERHMLDIKSNSFKEIIHRLSRLEHPDNILVLFESPLVAKVELLRMNLKFEANLETNYLISNEFSGMRVSLSQNVGTLYGLNHGLILENVSDAKTKIILIPNGNIETECTDVHISVCVKTEQNLHNPPFYQYQVDEFCCQLKARNGSFASWFYLAYLHAITSHGEIEPFIGMSGTERALQILQSAFAWSSSPYEPEAVKMLEMIANLTPLRNVKNHKQIVVWPDNIQPHSAQDCFIFIAKKLLGDSQRLCSLYSVNSSQLKLETDIKINERDHWRCQYLNPNLRVSNTFIPYKVLKTALPGGPPLSLCSNTRTVCLLYHKNQFDVPASLNLKTFLKIGRDTLDGNVHRLGLKGLLIHSVHDDFANLWISLYDAARKQELNREEFAVIFSYFAHDGEEIDPILALQAVATNPTAFEHINPPSFEKFPISSGSIDVDKISDILNEYYEQPDEYYSKKWEETGKRKQHDENHKEVINDIKAKIKNHWPFDSFDFCSLWSNRFKYIDYKEANVKIDKYLRKWYKNYQLDSFIKNVEAHLKSLRSSGLGSITLGIANHFSNTSKVAKHFIKSQIDFEAKIHACLNTLGQEVIVQAQNIWKMETRETIRSANEWWTIIREIISKSDETHYLIKSGIFPRIIPSLFLPKIIDPNTDERLKCLIGAWAMEITREQRQKRIQIYEHRPEFKAILDREKKDEPHINWAPYKYPEWLLFEIEQNLMIRKIQIEIAMRMIEPPEINTKHSVMQLNMGEGKTAVIVPILAAKLANGSQACQITVLKSLFSTNLKTLRQYLGGFLNQQIYILPCRRDMPIDDHIQLILRIYQECLKKRGNFYIHIYIKKNSYYDVTFFEEKKSIFII